MAFAQSHKIEYKDCADIDTLIEIWEQGYGGSVVECETGDDPLNVDIAPMSPTIFMPVVGSGATIKLNSATNGQFLGLYTIDPVKRMVKIYKDNKANPWWLGYINPEQYGESYSRLENYPVTINCNNGFNVLNRFKYLNGTAKYTTLETKWNILTRVLAKIGLPYQYIYFATKVSCVDVTVDADETLFHVLKADQLNYYNEQDEPMTYREVLEALLSVYGLQIRQEDGSIFIYEPQMLADANFSAKRFNGSTYAYVDTVTVTSNFDISSDEINWDNEDQVSNIKSGYSRQKIRYSPYAQDGAIPEIDLADRSNWLYAEGWTQDMYGIYRLDANDIKVNLITLSDAQVSLDGHKQYLDGPEEIYLGHYPFVSGNLWLSIPGHHVGYASDRAMFITGEVYIRSKHNEFNEAEASVIAECVRVPATLEIAGYRCVHQGGGVYTWEFESEVEPMGVFIYKAVGDVTICDKWLPFSIAIPPTGMPGGAAALKLFGPYCYDYFGGAELDATDGLIDSRYRNIKVGCYKGESTYERLIEVKDEDVLYKIDLDVAFINEAPELTQCHGDAVNMTDRAGICKTDNQFTSEWQKTGDTENFRILDLLLRSICSQYQDSLEEFSGTLEADELMGVNGGPNLLFTIQDTDYRSTKKYLFTGGTYNDFKRTLNGTYLEIKQEDITISVE